MVPRAVSHVTTLAETAERTQLVPEDVPKLNAKARRMREFKAKRKEELRQEKANGVRGKKKVVLKPGPGQTGGRM